MRRRLMLGLMLALAGCTITPPADAPKLVVFFQPWSADLDDAGKAAIANAGTWARNNPTQMLLVTGYADPEGSPEANIAISRARAQVVVDALVAGGVPPARIKRQGKGETKFIEDSLESRRVEITAFTP